MGTMCSFLSLARQPLPVATTQRARKGLDLVNNVATGIKVKWGPSKMGSLSQMQDYRVGARFPTPPLCSVVNIASCHAPSSYNSEKKKTFSTYLLFSRCGHNSVLTLSPI